MSKNLGASGCAGGGGGGGERRRPDTLDTTSTPGPARQEGSERARGGGGGGGGVGGGGRRLSGSLAVEDQIRSLSWLQPVRLAQPSSSSRDEQSRPAGRDPYVYMRCESGFALCHETISGDLG